MKSIESGHEVATGKHPHIEERHEGNESLFCLVHDGECGVTVEIHATPEEQQFLEEGLHAALEQLDAYLDGKFTECFKGLEIEIGDGLIEGGGEAYGENNKVILDKTKMMMTVAEEDALLAELGWADSGDRLRALPKEMHGMTAAVYELVHEVGHIIEERAELHLPKQERLKRAQGLAHQSPTNLYGKDPERPQEAFAEGFAYKIFGQQVDAELSRIIDTVIADFVRAGKASTN